MRIVQMIPVLAFGDAVGNDILAIRDILAGAGYRTEIYTEAVDRLLELIEGR